MQLGELQKHLEEFDARGAAVWAVSPDPIDKLKAFTEKTGVAFPLLSDSDLTVIRRWGILNPSSDKVPHPTAVVVDRDGVIRYLRQDVDYKKRPSAKELLVAVGDSAD